ncbi:cytochrome P450 [Cristinia sonorae]|uniref:Cytochrome P450 n=1 Tax=Cristinia sonorae TaxID=1940300 RepID=A0A8K0XNN5_9AGAR|nr:cytochrome P450 [Cristinia sonorae]
MPSILGWAAIVVVLIQLKRLFKAYAAIKAMKGLPTRFILFGPITIIGAIVPFYSRWYPRLIGAWIERHTRYAEFNSEAIVFVPVLYGDVFVQLASPEVSKTILADINAWPKPDVAVTLNEMGENVLTSRGDQWRLHRRAVTPAFSNETHTNVWEVTRSLYYQMLDTEEWRSGDKLFFPSISKYTTRLALLVIAACGFNMQLQWNEDGSSDGLTSPIDRAVVTVSSTIVERLNFAWIFRLPIEGLRKIDRAWADLHFWLNREVRTTKEELHKVMKLSGGDNKAQYENNVFGRLIAASMENGKDFDDSDVVGNLFIFFFAGHETTAWTLVNTLAMLALYQDEQERLYNHIRSVVGDRDPTPTDYPDLAPVLWCFYEALRLYPTAHIMLRTPSEDTVLSDPHLVASKENVLIPKGVIVIVDLIGTSRNPRHFPDGDAFNPLRWSNSSETSTNLFDQFLGFSTGPRVCVGKRFATFEAVCWLTLIMRDWKVDVKLNEGETREQWRERVMKPVMLATMRMDGDVPLTFTRRTSKA